MSLLVDMTNSALDPSYGEAAARNATASGSNKVTGERPRASVLLTALLVAVGLVTGVVAAQVRQRADVAGSVRRSLAAEVRRQTAETDALANRASELRRQVQTARDGALGEGSKGRAVAARVSALELLTGEVAVHGPGLQVRLDDAADADADTATGRGGQLGNGRIYDRDLADVANALWAAGAEAISINGQRLTATTAIRSAGEAVLVDFRPLSPPYLLRAIGNVDRMEPSFADGPVSRRFTTYTSLYGIGFQIARSVDLTLPAAGAPDLRLARPEGNP